MRSFIEYCQRLDISLQDAKKIYQYYVNHKILKLDKYHGSFHVTNGAFLDKPILLRALQESDTTID